MMIWAVSLLAMDLITHSLSAVLYSISIRSLVRFGKVFDPPSLSSALPLTINKQRST